MDESIRILVVDDHAVVREGLRALIDVQPDMELAGEAADGVEAVDRAIW
jgi:YesN/AraC family two-component response regulator